jgi:hypothetical protein
LKRLIHALSAAAIMGLGLGQMAVAEDSDVLLELFTSQGCSSCPPAEAVLSELAEREGVIALALHVDYWDYLGWRDQFAMPAMTARQRSYAETMDERSVYTPQIIIQGRAMAVGHNTRAIDGYIAQMRAQPQTVRLIAERYEDMIKVQVEPEVAGQTGVIHVVAYRSKAVSPISHGENRGRTLTHTNVVTNWSTVGAWEGDAASFVVPMPDAQDGGVVVILQAGMTGPVIAVDRLN